MIGRITQNQQKFFLNSQEIPGIQSVNASFSTNSSPVLYFGFSKTRTVPNGATSSNISVTRFLHTQDYFIGLTGNTGFNGFIVNDIKNAVNASQRNISFISGYMNSYRLTVNEEGIPENTVGFTAYNKFGGFDEVDPALNAQLINIQNSSFSETIGVPAYWSADLNIDNEFTSNKIQNLELEINSNYVPSYSFGSRYPKRVDLIYPIEVLCSFKSEIETLRPDSIHYYPTRPNKRNISLSLKNIDSTENIINYNFNGMELISETYEINVGESVFLNGTYRLYLNRPG